MLTLASYFVFHRLLTLFVAENYLTPFVPSVLFSSLRVHRSNPCKLPLILNICFSFTVNREFLLVIYLLFYFLLLVSLVALAPRTAAWIRKYGQHRAKTQRAVLLPSRSSARVQERIAFTVAQSELNQRVSHTDFLVDPVAARLRPLITSINKTPPRSVIVICAYACANPCSHPKVAPTLPFTP
jgi:hypothetical protein